MYAGEVVAFVGDNGAGKSTLVKTVAGVHRPDAGEIMFAGAPAAFESPGEASNVGIETVYQDLALADNLDVVANLFLGRERTARSFRTCSNPCPRLTWSSRHETVW